MMRPRWMALLISWPIASRYSRAICSPTIFKKELALALRLRFGGMG
jgi:hypothetical protein